MWWLFSKIEIIVKVYAVFWLTCIYVPFCNFSSDCVKNVFLKTDCSCRCAKSNPTAFRAGNLVLLLTRRVTSFLYTSRQLNHPPLFFFFFQILNRRCRLTASRSTGYLLDVFEGNTGFGSRNSVLVERRTRDQKDYEFESRQERWQNFLLRTLCADSYSVSVYRSGT